MDLKIQREKRRLRRIIPVKIRDELMDLLDNHGKVSKEGHVSSSQYFFARSESSELKKRDIQVIYGILNRYNLPEKLSALYSLICNEDVEYYFSNWTLISLNSLERNYNYKKKDGQSRVVDFANLYIGMGHCIVCSVDPEDGKIFYRYDGGSNSFDRTSRYKQIIKFVPSDEYKYDIDNWLKWVLDKTVKLNDINFINTL